MREPPAPEVPPAGLWALYLGFLSIGARSFGGVLPWAHRVLVEARRWLSSADFAEVLGLCQFLPGPNVGNSAVVFGRRWLGFAGAAVAFPGLMALPSVWVLALALLHAGHAAHPSVRAMTTGVGIAGAGLFIGTAVKLGRPLAGKPAAPLIAGGAFAAVALARISIASVIPVAALASLAAARRRLL